jgi:hypothetical protein
MVDIFQVERKVTMLLLKFLPFFSSFGAIFKSLLDIGTLVFKTAFEFVVWYLKEFWKGLGVIFHNLSVLTVLLVVFIGGGWYFKTWDNDRILAKCKETCPAPVVSKVYDHPIKERIKKIYVRVPTQRPPLFKPKDSFKPFGEQ